MSDKSLALPIVIPDVKLVVIDGDAGFIPDPVARHELYKKLTVIKGGLDDHLQS